MFDFFAGAFYALLYQPLFNLLILFYEYLPGRDFGAAVIVLTALIRIAVYPLAGKAIKSQKAIAELQPKLNKIRKKYKNNKEAEMEAVLALYKKSGVNPASGCLPLLIQLPVLIALYQVFWKGLQPESMKWLYGFVPNPGPIDPVFLGFVNLAEASALLAVAAGILQFVQAKTALSQTPLPSKSGSPADSFARIMQAQMVYFFPFFTVYILSPWAPWKLPSAIALYWIVTTLFAIIQQHFIFAEKGEKEKRRIDGAPAEIYNDGKPDAGRKKKRRGRRGRRRQK